MGLFKSITHAVSKTVSNVAKTVTSPTKLTTAVLTGGVSVVAPKITAPISSAVKSTLYNPALATKVLSVAGGPSTALIGGSLPSIGSPNMAGINLGNILGGVVSGLGSLVGGASPSTALNSFSQFLPSVSGNGLGLPPSGSTNPYAVPVMASGVQALRSVATVGRSFFNKFPNLATAIQGYRNMGKNVTRAKLYSLLKRFGPEILISGGLLTAAAVNELMVAGPGRRRMNAGNIKALRRSVRRLESFHHLCTKVDKLRRPRSSKKSGRGASQQFVRQG